MAGPLRQDRQPTWGPDVKYCAACHATYPSDVNTCPVDRASLRTTSELIDGLVIRGKYEILNRIGVGGMAWVYRVRHLAFDEIRAIKVLRSSMAEDEDFVRRLKSEAVITRRLRHPNAVQVEDFDQMEDGRPFIVMEYVEGPDVRNLLQQTGPMPVGRVLRIAAQVLSALNAAHSIGIIHRDIKPDNIILIPEADSSDFVKVLDFGIAKLREAKAGQLGLTRTGFIICTPEYASPEQVEASSNMDGRSDLYSLGIVMYEMLTGNLPFRADSQMAMLLQQLNSDPVPPDEKYPALNIPRPVSQMVMKALAKDAAARFQSANEMLSAVRRLIPEYPVTTAQSKPRAAPVMSTVTWQTQSEPARITEEERQQQQRGDVSSVYDLLADDEPASKSHVWLWTTMALVLIGLGIGAAIYRPSLYDYFAEFIARFSPPPSNVDQPTTDRNRAAEVSESIDHQLQQKAETAIAPLAASGAHIDATVANGAITLRGTAPNAEVAESAQRRSAQETGLAVANAIQITPTSRRAPAILNDVRDAIVNLEPTARNIDAVVENGIVTLTGTAQDQNAIDQAVAAASRVPGVIQVSSKVQLVRPLNNASAAATFANLMPPPVPPPRVEAPPRTSPHQKVQQLISRARQLRKAGQYDKALGSLDQALAIEPENEEAQQLVNEIEQTQRWVQENIGAQPDH